MFPRGNFPGPALCIGIALALLSAHSPALAAARDKKEDAAKAERELIAREDEQAAKLADPNKDGYSDNPLVYFQARGKLTLQPPDGAGPDVVGQFVASDRGYLVKLAGPDFLKTLKIYDGKEVTLQGKLRAEGKYFVVNGVAGGGAPPVQRTNKRRI